MEDSTPVPDIRKDLNLNASTGKTQSKGCVLAAIPKKYSQMAFKRITSIDQHVLCKGTAVELGWFLLKIAALDMLRRFSKAHCPFVWHGLRGLQLICYSPFKWIQKWVPFRGLIKFMQNLSRPLLVLSVATTFCDRTENVGETSSDTNDSLARSDPQSGSHATSSTTNTRSALGSRSLAFEKWISQLLAELDKEGMTLPERMNKDELQRFYDAANGHFSCFVSSIKKTIRWRQNFKFLSLEELDAWSDVVFWHGFDTKQRPCLIIRLGLACCNVTSEGRFHFPEVVVSQIEYGILHLIDAEDRRVAVLMDCEGLTPFGVPVQMMRSFALLMQDHYPNRLAACFVIRLPSVARVITQTLFQVLRPATRQKLRILGDNYREILSEYLQKLPSFLGGDCSCVKCSPSQNTREATYPPELLFEPTSSENVSSPHSRCQTDDFDYPNCKRALKIAIFGLLLLLLCIAFHFRIHDIEALIYSICSW